MLSTQKKYLLLGICLLLITATTGSASQNAVDHTIFAELLKNHVSQGRVDYQGFKKNEQRLDTYLAVLEKIDAKSLSPQERMAYYINIYNAWTIKLILTAYPDVKSIKDLGSLFQTPWKKEFVKINGQVVTLDHIEHDILRPMFKDPRIHFAINCAALSCPPLLNEPYEGATLDRQLNAATTSFINDPDSNYIKGKRLHVSKIFKWFNEDFKGDILGFFKQYAKGQLKRKLDSQGVGLNIKYLSYDWSLNGT